MRLVNTHTSKLSLVVRFVDELLPSRVIGDDEIDLSVLGPYRQPYYKGKGQWIFMDLATDTVELDWLSRHYQNGSNTVNISSLPILMPLVELPLSHPLPLEITFKKFSRGYVGQHYETQVTIEGGKSPYYFYAINLPLGLRINHSTGLISGIPIETDRVYVTLKVTDANRNHTELIKRITIRE